MVCSLQTETTHSPGMAIYIYCILPKFIKGGTSETHLTFLIDGKPVGHFDYFAHQTTTGFQYDHLVFSQTTLLDDQHAFTLVNHGVPGSLALFDYAIYR